MSQESYTYKQYSRDKNNLSRSYDNNEIDENSYKEKVSELHKKLPTKEILKDPRGMDQAARLAAIDTVNRTQKIEKEKLEPFYDHKLKPDCNIVNFNLGGNFNTMHQLCGFKLDLLNGFVDQKFDSTIKDIGLPFTEEIDYSLIKDSRKSRYGEVVTPYKNGFLIVRDDNPKGAHFFCLYQYVDKGLKDNNILEPILRMGDKTYFINKEIAEQFLEYKEGITIYMAFTKAYKNKVYKIHLRKNDNLISILEAAVKRDDEYALNIYRSLPKNFNDDIAEMNGVFDYIDFNYDQTKKSNEGSSSINEDKFNEYSFNKLRNVNKLDLLKSSYTFSFVAKAVGFINMMNTFLQNKKESDDSMKEFIEPFLNCKNTEDISIVLFEELNSDNTKFLNQSKRIKQKLYSYSYAKKQENEFSSHTLVDVFLDLFYMHNFTEKGTSVSVDGATQIDCLYYWKYADYFSLAHNFLGNRDYPLFLEKGEIFNKNNLWEHFEEFRFVPHQSTRYNETYELDPDVKEKVSLILNEAMSQETGLLIPYNACVELQDDTNLRYARFIETEDFIHIFLHDENDRYLSELYCKRESEFRYWLVNRKQILDEPDNLKDMFDRLYVKLASCIRDWKVLIERDRTMNYRGRRVPTGVKSDVKRIIYLPRVKYRTNPDAEQRKREKVFFNESRKFSGERRAHIRRLPKGMKPSKAQLVLAESNGVYIPENYTFVKESVWGRSGMTQRQIKYRTRSLNGLLYCPDSEFKQHRDIADISPADFEEYCGEYFKKLGYEVYKRNNYDGGIDIRAVKKDGSRLFVQCKHPIESGNPIGADVVRELEGSVELEKKDLEDCVIDKMIITSTRYTFKAVEAARKLNIELKTTDDIK